VKTCVTCGQNLPVDKLEAAGQDAVLHARSDWGQDIFDPKPGDRSADAVRCCTIIGAMIREGLGWTWEPEIYKGDGTFEWCGAAVSRWWWKVKPELRKLYFSSTYRLDRYAQYQPAFGEENVGKGRLYAQLDEHTKRLPWSPRAGDILTIGPTGSGYGKHICLVESFDDEALVFHTIEGNGNGLGPHGERQQGVVKGVRPLGGAGVWHARRLIRPSVADLV
jgi:hypothetical protein